MSIPKGPADDPDQNLKQYFNKITDEGFKVNPHPEWNWTQGADGHYQ